MKTNNNLDKIYLLILLMTYSFLLLACTRSVFPSTKRPSFSPKDLLVTLDNMPPGWKIKFGPEKAEDNTRSTDSAWISFAPSSEDEKYLVLDMVFRYQSNRGAKADFSDQTRFPENIPIKEWDFESKIADESRFSCYTYSNDPTPVCNWVARYDYIVIELIVRLEPDGLSLQEMEELVKTIDQKVDTFSNKNGVN